jgi:hypothetical protein
MGRTAAPIMIEKHYTIKQVSALLQISLERTRQMVMAEPGVLRIAPAAGGRPARRYMWRIPQSVLERILKRNSNPA